MSDEGGEDSPPPARPQRRIKKVMVLSSASESDSDASEGPTRTRKRRLRVLSDDDGASSSGSSAGARRRRAPPPLQDSDSDSSRGVSPKSGPASGFASDSSEGNSDKCSICLLRFKDQEVGTPQSCEHIFCLDCIMEWSKNVNTCPVDRMTFDSIVVKTCAGGRVLRTEPVQVVERRPSVEMLVVEDPTVCEICGSIENEDTMLLCDGCDLGFHMQCLSPPLLEIPIDQWYCPSCISVGMQDAGNLEDIIYLSEVDDLFSDITDMERPQGPRPAPLRQAREARETRRSARAQGSEQPSTSSGRAGAPASSRARAPPRRRRKRRRQNTRTVIIEYEIEENGKFPITRRVKKTVRKRKIRKRRPRTAARRSLVRSSVRAQLSALRAAAEPSVCASVSDLHVRRARAGVPALSLFGSDYDLEYFDDDGGAEPGAAVAVAARPSASVISAYRQAKRKLVALPSPPAASAAPDLLSGILHSQELLHARRPPGAGRREPPAAGRSDPPGADGRDPPGAGRLDPPGAGRLDPLRAPARARAAPAYPGQRGGWGGGYSGNYHREQSANNFGRGYDERYGAGPGPPPRPAYNNGRREDEAWAGFPRRREPAAPRDDPPPRRRAPAPPPAQRRSLGDAWPRARAAPGPPRRSLGADDPLDMRLAPARPLPEPPVFRFDKPGDDADDAGQLVIDTDKYDPTEPTRDEDDSDEPAPPPAPAAPEPEPEPTAPPPAPPAAPLPAPPAPPAPPGADALAAAELLDTAVRAVLHEHRALVAPARARSDDDDDGDCPNFSIYSATSVHIACAGSLAPPPAAPRPEPDLADLVQEDDEPPRPAPAPAPASALTKKDEEYKEKVSKRCPITANTRNPIKIKLQSSSLIKRVSLYDDDDDLAPGAEPESAAPGAADPGAPQTAEPGDDDSTIERCEVNERTEVDPEAKAEKDASDDELEENGEKAENHLSPEDTSPAGSPAGAPQAAPEDDPPEESPKEQPSESPDKQNGLSASPRSERSPRSPHSDSEPELAAPPEKMTESISETEDSRSYTPCLDEPRGSPRAAAGLGTELISEDEARGVFSDAEPEPKKKRKPLKKEAKSKPKPKKDVAFRKLGKQSRARTYRDKERRRRSASSGSPRSPRASPRRRDKRKDLERYDVRSVVTEKRKKFKDPFGRDVSPAPPARSRSPERARRSLSRAQRSPSRLRRSLSRAKRSLSRPRRSLSRPRRSLSRAKRSLSRPRRSLSRAKRSLSRAKRSLSRARKSPSRARRTPSPLRRRASLRSLTPPSPRASPPRRSPSPRRAGRGKRRASPSPRRRASPRRREPSTARARKRRRSPERSPKPKLGKKKKRARSPGPLAARRAEPRRKSPKRKKKVRRSPSRLPSPAPGAPPAGWSPMSVDSRLLSPRTPPPDASPASPARRGKRKRKEPRHAARHKRGKDAAAPSKEVFTSGDNILVSVSFAEQQHAAAPPERRKHREARRDKRKRRAPVAAAAKPVAIIDLERSPFRELTPSPKNVIVLSDSDHGDKAAPAPAPPEPAHPAPAFAPGAVGPKTPPEPAAAPAPPPVKFTLAAKPAGPARAPNPLREDEPAEAPAGEEAGGPATPPEPPDSPDAYDPFEPTRSASGSPAPAEPPAPDASPERPSMTLEAAQRTNMSADDVLARRPLEPIEKVMALLQSTRDEAPEPPPEPARAPPAQAAPPAQPAPAPAPPQRAVLPAPQPKLFLAKPSPIKSNPIKPMQAVKLPLPPRAPEGESPYSPGSSDFGDLFSPPPARRDTFDSLFGAKPRRNKSHAAKVPVKFNRKKGKPVGVKLDDDSLKVLDELPSSAVEMQVKSKFLKKLNRQERVVEEVKLVLKPHYTRKRVSKDEYKDILRRAVPKICHNKTGEINPAKIQALVEAYVKKARKKHKLGLA